MHTHARRPAADRKKALSLIAHPRIPTSYPLFHRPLRPFLEVAPLRVLGTWLDIRQEVTTRCLDRAFHALTTYPNLHLHLTFTLTLCR